MITKKQLAARIDGREYREETTRQDRADAKASGLVIAYGASDDLLEVEGAMFEEFGAYGGANIRFTDNGVTPGDDDESVLKKYGYAMPPLNVLKAEWCPEDEPKLSWRITCSLPSAPFTIYEDGEPFCRGVVFELPAVKHGKERGEE